MTSSCNPLPETPQKLGVASTHQPSTKKRRAVFGRAQGFFGSFFSGLLDLLYPHRCPGCGELCQKEAVFCTVCRISVEPIREPLCPKCFMPHDAGESHLCLDCLAHPPPFDRAVAVFRYGGELAIAIQRLKYGPRPDLARPLGSLLTHHIAAMEPEVITPVPLTKAHLRKRGFNQSLELIKGANLAGRFLILPGLMARTGRGTPQARKTLKERKKLRVKEFRVRHPQRIKNRSVLVVDDVMTTGATARACSLALLKAGARKVSFLVLARTARDL